MQRVRWHSDRPAKGRPVRAGRSPGLEAELTVRGLAAPLLAGGEALFLE